MKIRINLKYNLVILFNFIIFFALLKPDSLEYIGLKWLDTSLVLVDGILMIVLIFFMMIKKYKISKISFWIILIYVFMFYPTLIGTKALFDLLKVGGTAIGMALLTDFYMQKHPKVFLDSAVFTLIVLFTYNFYTIIKYYPIGMYKLDYVVGDLYFMGHDNGMIYNLLPMCGLAIIISYIKKGKIFTILSVYTIALLFASELYVKSATGIIESILLILLLLMLEFKLIKKIIKPELLFSLFFALTVAVVVFRIQNKFSWLFVDILHKDLTFTGRTFIWDNAINMVKSKFFIGNGLGLMIIGANGHSYPNPHCLLLDFLLKGGFFCFISFICLLICYIKKYNKMNDAFIKKVLLIITSVILVGEITAAVPYKAFFWSFLVLIQYSDALSNLKNEKVKTDEGKVTL